MVGAVTPVIVTPRAEERVDGSVVEIVLAADSAPVGLSKMSRTLTLTLADVTVSDASDAFGNIVRRLERKVVPSKDSTVPAAVNTTFTTL